MLAGRYRIQGLIGRGGMGEVYRASDVKLGQLVALKFLPQAAARDERMMARLHAEVRIARQVSHPNVCRVYDIGELDGLPFLTMEYVDGEDLGSLLRRIGRLPGDKAVEIARRLSAGLAAAHDKGVLHRDLKPSNIMIDGRGQVLITDFGLAALAGQVQPGEIRSGSPPYMSPEQFAGREVTVRSDLYSLGLVLYEMFSGRRAFADRHRTPPESVSSHVKDIDPAVERVIARCLEEDPLARPSSALAIVAALPGGDPLAAALAAGSTPSPEMVAAAGENDAMPVRTAVRWMTAALAGLTVALLLAGMANPLTSMRFDKSTDVLAQIARDVTESLGYTEQPTDRAYGFGDGLLSYQRYAASRLSPEEYRAQRASGKSPLVYFWYRQSPRYLEPVSPLGMVNTADPPLEASGMVNLTLNPAGRLLSFVAVPPQVDDPAAGPAAPVDWRPAFAAAGLDPAQFVSTQPGWSPLAGFDTRSAWTGTYPVTPTIPLRIEAAAWRGKPVYFELIFPWTQPLRMEQFRLTAGQRATNWIWFGLFFLIVVAAALLAWRNYSLGRGYMRGAMRLAAVAALCRFLSLMGGAHHVPGLLREIKYFLVAASLGLLMGAVYWALYIALEPYVRRHWPECLIGWTRLLSGGLRDPMMGGNLLAGVVLGLAFSMIDSASLILAARYGEVSSEIRFDSLLGGRQAMSVLSGILAFQPGWALWALFLSFLLFVLLRRRWLVIAAWLLLYVGSGVLQTNHPLIVAPFLLLYISAVLFGLFRFGVLATAVALFVQHTLGELPVTADLSEWYSGPTFLALAVILLLAIYGFYTALAGRPLFKDGLLRN